jgi:hypothetical protein
MKAKTFEIRDAGTFIPALAISLDPASDEHDRYLLERAGFGGQPFRTYVLLIHLTSMKIAYDPAHWTNRTMVEAHEYIRTMFSDLDTGDVVDVEFIRGDTDEAKRSERLGQATRVERTS